MYSRAAAQSPCEYLFCPGRRPSSRLCFCFCCLAVSCHSYHRSILLHLLPTSRAKYLCTYIKPGDPTSPIHKISATDSFPGRRATRHSVRFRRMFVDRAGTGWTLTLDELTALAAASRPSEFYPLPLLVHFSLISGLLLQVQTDTNVPLGFRCARSRAHLHNKDGTRSHRANE